MIFADTSAVVTYFDRHDRNHAAAVAWLHGALDQRASLLTHSHAVVETIAVLQRKLGMDAVRDYASHLEPALEVVWVDRELHRRGLAGLMAADHRGLSLVDCVSFEVMRELGIETAFTFDGDFAAQGFTVVP